jgi:hypothetical protein
MPATANARSNAVALIIIEDLASHQCRVNDSFPPKVAAAAFDPFLPLGHNEMARRAGVDAASHDLDQCWMDAFAAADWLD